MSSRRSVALLIETSNGYCRGLLEGIIAYTKERADWSVYLSEQERGAPPPTWLESWTGHGVIARVETQKIGDRLKQFGLPIVDLSANRHLPDVPWAETDDLSIAELAIEHFQERGFTEIAYCGDPGFAWSTLRCEQLKRLSLEKGLMFYEHQSIPRYDPGFSWDFEKQRLADWLKELPRPVAIMACYDFKAQQVADVCRQLKIVVPEEVAVLGVDNDRLICELAEPPLSSVIPDTKRTGFEAAELLDSMMAGHTVTGQRRLVTKALGVHVRESTDVWAVRDQDVAAALRYIRKHATANIRVSDVLRHVHLSRRVLESRFQKSLGRTPHEEIQRVRTNRVKSLLLDTDFSISQIARHAGFEHGEYMAAAFKRETGVTPTAFRLANQGSH